MYKIEGFPSCGKLQRLVRLCVLHARLTARFGQAAFSRAPAPIWRGTPKGFQPLSGAPIPILRVATSLAKSPLFLRVGGAGQRCPGKATTRGEENDTPHND